MNGKKVLLAAVVAAGVAAAAAVWRKRVGVIDLAGRLRAAAARGIAERVTENAVKARIAYREQAERDRLGEHLAQEMMGDIGGAARSARPRRARPGDGEAGEAGPGKT